MTGDETKRPQLSEETSNRYKIYLLAEKGRLTETLKTLNEKLPRILEGFEPGDGFSDRRVAETNHRESREMLRCVQKALERLEQGTFGLCDTCGKPIDPDRLDARPYVENCVNCKPRGLRVR